MNHRQEGMGVNSANQAWKQVRPVGVALAPRGWPPIRRHTVPGLVLAALGALAYLAACLDSPASAKGSQAAPTRPSASTILSEIPEGQPPPAPSHRVIGLHRPTKDRPPYTFAERGQGVTFVVERGAQVEVVHNGRPGKRYAAVGSIALSPDGRRCAYGALIGQQWRMVVDGQEGPPFSAVQQPVFSPDGLHLAYQAMAGERWHLVADGTTSGGTATRYDRHEFSGDGSRLVFVDDVDTNGLGRLMVSDLAFKAPTMVAVGVASFALDPARVRVAAIAGPDGQRQVLVAALDQPGRVERGPVYGAVDGLTLGDKGAPTYVAERGGQWRMVVGEVEGLITPGEFVVFGPVPRPDGAVVSAAVASRSTGQVTVRRFGREGWQVGPAYQEAEGLAWDADGHLLAYAARKGDRWMVVVDGKEGPPLDRVVSPAFAPGGRWVVYRARQDGQRFVVLAGRDGATVRQYPPHEQVFQVHFTAGGAGLAYGTKDGRRLAWTEEGL
jgi:hypothetical protein